MIVLETKFFPLQLDENIISRERLTRLMGSAGQHRCLAVVAPAGFGKSTLVRQWLDQSATNACWLTLDRSDNHPGNFWHYVLECFRRGGLDDAELFALLNNAETNTQALVSGLINRLGAVSEKHFSLILDDFHLIQDASIIEGITFLVDFAPANLTLILTSRNEPPFPYARWKVKRFARVLYSADLVFNSDETRDLLANSLDLAVDSSQLEQIMHTTGGWAAALQLLAHGSLPKVKETLNEGEFSRALSSNRRDIEDYIAQEVLDDLPEDLRDFILKLAPANRFDVEIANAVRHASDSHEHIAKLESRNLFLIALDDHGQWFRFHELLRDGTLHYLKTRYPDLLQEYSQQIINFHLGDKHYIEAIELIIELNAWDRLVSTLEDIGNNLIRQGYHLNILHALQQVPEDMVQRSPKLQVVKLWCLFYNNQFSEIPPLLKTVNKLIAKTDLPASLRLELDLLDAYMARFSKDVERARAVTERTLSQLEESSAPVKSLAYFGLGNDYFALGAYDEAEKALREAITLGKLEQRFSTVKSSLGLLLWIYQIRGEFIRALDLYKQVDVWIKSFHKDDPEPKTISCWLNSSLILIYTEQDQLEHASGYLYPMFSLIQSAEPLQKMLVYFVQGEYQRLTFQYEDAIKSLDQAQAVLNQNDEEIHPFAPPILATKAETLWQMGAAERAGDLIDEIAENAYQDSSPHRLQKFLEVKAIIDMQRDPQSVFETCARMEKLGIRGKSPKSLALAHLFKARALALTDQQHESRLELVKALSLGEQNDYIQMFRMPIDTWTFDIGALQHDGINQSFLEKVSETSSSATSSATATAYSSKDGEKEQGQINTPSEHQNAVTEQAELLEPLSRREQEVLELINQGLPNKKIATKLSLAPATIKAHIRNIYGKIDATSRTDALAKARQLGLIR
ncbi:LuxR C-terminal-related transcriptional regulator [Hahella ganghwensis]|uniref:LuxR C-terminal-related transcriptional regulator n=1 Tax=Hahella ganghwensis TaxID=286420 RepID=UPI000380F8F3|nr:LuxR C-terminal-related transcriptional regulator [Hahella ganghwensis]